MNNDLVEIDLDDVVRKPIRLNLNGKKIIISLPTFQQLVELVRAGLKMQKVMSLPREEQDKAVDEFMYEFKSLFPEIADEHLNLDQVGKLMGELYKIALPSEAKQLESIGLSPDNSDQKKIDSDPLK